MGSNLQPQDSSEEPSEANIMRFLTVILMPNQQFHSTEDSTVYVYKQSGLCSKY